LHVCKYETSFEVVERLYLSLYVYIRTICIMEQSFSVRYIYKNEISKLVISNLFKIQKLFKIPQISKTFQNSSSHRILEHMREPLDIDENKN
jgi:hypothetical protein